MSKIPFKRFFITAITILAILSVVTSTTSAASTAKSLSTNFTLINLGSTSANVQISFLTDSASGGTDWQGVSPGSTSFSLDANGGQKQIRQYADAGMLPGSGSAVVSSSQPLAAVVQIQARNQPAATNGAYVGASKGSDTFYVPLVAHHGFSASGTVNSQIIIQNAGSVAADVTVTMTAATGSTGSATKTISALAPGISYYYDLETETQLPSTGWFGSAIVHTDTTGGSLVVISNLFSGPDGLQAYNAFPKEILTNSWVVPIFTAKLTNGLSTVVTIQNLGGTQTDGSLLQDEVRLDCKANGSDTVTLTKTNPSAISKNQSYSFNPVNNTAYPDNWFGSCVVSAPANTSIVAFVQMRVVMAGMPPNAAAYEAIPSNQTSTSVFVPLIAQHLDNGFATVVNVANLSSQSNNVQIDYIPSSTECPVSICDVNKDGKVDASDTVTYTDSIPGNGGIQRNNRTGSDLPSNWVGSMKVKSTSNLALGAIVQLTNYKNLPGDTLMAHDAFGQ